MSKIYFKPWVGRNYGKTNGIRLLILGESHYGPKESKSDFTQQLTKAYVNHEWNHRFWTNIMQVIDGRKYWEIDRDVFWSEVAFYNYIQEPVAETAGVAPSPDMWAIAEEPFLEVLPLLKPTHIVVLSKRLWKNMTSKGERGDDLSVNKVERETRLFPYEGGFARATWLPHPSYGFSANEWHPDT
ncbi:MAG: hypothetical protein M0Z61_10195 [Nitrospiraceae bacterium]|nr:hypothetical protein [Nitrospiraceae bacterium]